MKMLKPIAAATLLTLATAPAFANPGESTAGQINLNKASKEEMLKGVKGLTAAQADAIISHRNKEGVLVNLHELHYLGIGPDVIGSNYGKITVGNVSTADKKKH